MPPAIAGLALTAAGLALAALTPAAAYVQTPASGDGWFDGRATFFGAPQAFADSFKDRGEGAFGDLLWGSCGYFNKPQGVEKIRDEDMPFDQEHAAALANVNPDFPGSCGRCYEVRCKEGIVPKDYLPGGGATPFQVAEHYYMPAVAPGVLDGQGRAWPGNPEDASGLQAVQCWPGGASTWVRIVDSCPPNPNSPWCAANSTVYHFDLSYWAFEKLAHPLYGAMGVQFRPIDCDTKAPLALLPGAISRTIYHDGTGVGWSWQAWKNGYQLYSAAGSGRGGSHAVCASLMVGGGMRFICRGCDKPGYQPFGYGAKALEFSVKADTSVLDFAASPADSIPPLKVFLVRGSDEQESFDCADVFLQSYQGAQSVGEGYFKFTIPLADFRCALADLTGVGFTSTDDGKNANINGPYTAVCLDDIHIV